MKISVVGVGYVGLITAIAFAELGNQVIGLDADRKKIDKLNKNIVPFFEPDLEKLLQKAKKNKKITFTADYQKGIGRFRPQVIFICVGTPSKENGSYELAYVFSAAKSIAQNLKQEAVIAVKSTVPPFTNNKINDIFKRFCRVKYELASCPEFLREGSAMADFFQPDRIVIGCESPKAKKILLQLHQPLGGKRVICDPLSSQMIKYTANSFLAAKISFINAISQICEIIGADIEKVSLGIGLDKRIGKEFLKPGLGYGGSCFPKDISALVSFSQKIGYDFSFLKQVNQINKMQIIYFKNKIKKLAKNNLKSKKIAVLGLSFKPNTDDLRESKAIELIKLLQKEKAIISAYDPVAMKKAKKILKSTAYAKNPYLAAEKADILVLATEWPEFRRMDFKKIKKIMIGNIICDGRNFLDKDKLKKMGFIYEGVGRK